MFTSPRPPQGAGSTSGERQQWLGTLALACGHILAPKQEDPATGRRAELRGDVDDLLARITGELESFPAQD